MQAVAARLSQLHAPEQQLDSGATAALELLHLVNEKGRELAHQARWALLSHSKPMHASCLLTTSLPAQLWLPSRCDGG